MAEKVIAPPLEFIREQWPKLTKPEADVLTQLAGGWTLKQIAFQRAVRNEAVWIHMPTIYEKTNTQSQNQVISTVWREWMTVYLMRTGDYFVEKVKGRLK